MCTDFQITTDDGAVIIGRSMEWAFDMQTRLQLHPAGEERKCQATRGNGFHWKSSYAFVGADAYNLDLVLDGMNTAGLSIGFLWMPDTEYETITEGDTSDVIDIADLGSWLLGTCSTVADCIDSLAKVKVSAGVQASLGGVPTIHIALHDSHGKNAVVEFTNGEKRIFDNPNGVLTNSPTFDWHLTNLRNYLHLSPTNPKPVTLHGTVLNVPGQGGGFLGIPGDWTPPSRFVRTTAMLGFAKKPPGAKSGILLAQHVLNAVDIPMGDVRAESDATICDYTQWALVKDLTNKVLFYRTYEDLTLRQFDLKDLAALGAGEVRFLPLNSVSTG